MKRKILPALIIFAAALCLLSVTAFAKVDDIFYYESIRYRIKVEPAYGVTGEVAVADNTANGTEVYSIPSMVLNAGRMYSVTSVDESAFEADFSLVQITLPESVTQIESAAFRECEYLTTVNIPGGVTRIEYATFDRCNDLINVSFAEDSKLTSIGERAFAECLTLTGTIVIPDGVTDIEDGAFMGCLNLSGVVLPKNLKTIGAFAFYDNRKLGSISIPNTVTEIGEQAFYYAGKAQTYIEYDPVTGEEIEVIKDFRVEFEPGTYDGLTVDSGRDFPFPDRSKFIIDGGSLNAPYLALAGRGVTNSSDVPVYMTTVTMKTASGGVRTFTDIDALLDADGGEIDYDLTDTRTDINGKLYLWLPKDTALSSVRVKDNSEGTLTTTFRRASGALTVADNSAVAGGDGDQNVGEFTEHYASGNSINVDIIGCDDVEAVVFPSNNIPYVYSGGAYSDPPFVTKGSTGASYSLMFRVRREEGSGYSWTEMPQGYVLKALYFGYGNKNGSQITTVSDDFIVRDYGWGGSIYEYDEDGNRVFVGSKYGGKSYTFTMPGGGANITAVLQKNNGSAPKYNNEGLSIAEFKGYPLNYFPNIKGDLPMTFRLADGYSLPPGITLGENGEIYGTPTEAGSFEDIMIVAENSYGTSFQYVYFYFPDIPSATDSDAYDIPSGTAGTEIEPVDISSMAPDIQSIGGYYVSKHFNIISRPDWLGIHSDDGILFGTRPESYQGATTAVIQAVYTNRTCMFPKEYYFDSATITINIGEVTAAPLKTPQTLLWDGRTARWNEISHADRYTVELYKDGTSAENRITFGMMSSVWSFSNSYDFSSYIEQNGAGMYYFRVRAVPLLEYGKPAAYLSGEYSAFSAGYDTEHEHIMLHIPETPATCAAQGEYEHYACTVCNDLFWDAAGTRLIADRDDTVMPKSSHNLPSAYETDAEAHFNHCTVCGEVVGRQEHRYTSDCDVSCNICGYTRSDAAPHTPGEEASELTPQTCTVCGYVIAPATHTVHTLTLVTAVEPTGTANGNISYYVCSVCGEWFFDADGNESVTDRSAVLIGRRGFAVETGGKKYYSDGYALRGWQEIDGDIYYFIKGNGYAVVGEKSVGGVLCSFDADGKFTGWATFSSGKRYYPNGTPFDSAYLRGWQQIDGDWYYFVSSNGGFTAVGDKTIGGVSYNFDENGIFTGTMKNGLVNEDGGIRYYKFNVRQTGWQDVGENRYYFYQSTGFAVTENRFVGGVYCCFDENGIYREPRNGFVTDAGDTRYYKNDFHVTGWRQIEGDWYYFYVSTGLMVTESRVIGGVWYDIAPDGKIAR